MNLQQELHLLEGWMLSLRKIGKFRIVLDLMMEHMELRDGVH